MDNLIPLVLLLSAQYDLDPNIVWAVIEVESQGNVTAIGESGEIGLMQILPKYSKVPVKRLYDPVSNIREGVSKLVEARNYCKHQKDLTWITCYNAGVTGGSKLKHPKKFPYYKKFMSVYKNNEVRLWQ